MCCLGKHAFTLLICSSIKLGLILIIQQLLACTFIQEEGSLNHHTLRVSLFIMFTKAGKIKLKLLQEFRDANKNIQHPFASKAVDTGGYHEHFKKLRNKRANILKSFMQEGKQSGFLYGHLFLVVNMTSISNIPTLLSLWSIKELIKISATGSKHITFGNHTV